MKDSVKDLYVSGKSIDELCTALNISRQTFYYHKKADFKRGIDWDALKLSNLRSEEELENKEALFVNSLIQNYEKFLQEAGTLSPEHIENLHKFAKTYWSIKAPRQINQKEIELKTAKLTIKSIAELAISHKQNEVANWLSQNAEAIILKVVKSDKN
ncbi:DUF1804 family protein [Campylobacter gastrosuis]|uniref:DUF1804 family protein n=1 Tax=Campylobacter gastrosuis TaxID=2974576 RepID=A0ABT7HMM0_9BACT|nr:DUF1804 family protein [Campylobacter gastrosuis]MDL0088154.1 DUF1804 family protein [Campylobacter gastrosuis]